MSAQWSAQLKFKQGNWKVYLFLSALMAIISNVDIVSSPKER
jgi:hypothetical protein